MKAVDWIKPSIYDTFQCKGASCHRTCCAGWKITVSKSEYQDLKEKLNHREIKTIDRLPTEERSTQMYGEFLLEAETGCTLQSKEGLCDLQLSFGAEALPHVCTVFPRRAVRYDNQLQVTLTPACERVLELLLELNGSMEFVCQKAPLPSHPTLQPQIEQVEKLLPSKRYNPTILLGNLISSATPPPYKYILFL